MKPLDQLKHAVYTCTSLSPWFYIQTDLQDKFIQYTKCKVYYNIA